MDAANAGAVVAEDRPAARGRRLASIALAGLAFGAGLVGLRLGLTPSPSSVLINQNVVGSLATFVLVSILTIDGLILQRRRPDHSIGWLLLAGGAMIGVSSLLWGITYVAALPGGDVQVGRRVAWVGTVVTLSAWTILLTTLVICFPSGRPSSARDARILKAQAVLALIAGILAGLRPGQFLVFPQFTNPLDLPPALDPVVRVAATGAVIALIIPIAFAAWGMVDRYRRASTVERLQLRWFAYATSLVIVGAVLYLAIGIVLAPNNDVLREWTYVILILAISSLPIAVLQAITRHRLYDIDTIIGRTVAYGALTAILAGVYAASVRLFNALFVAATGQESEAALVLTTLVVATTFTPIKTYLEKLAAKRFPATPVPTPAADPLVTAPHDDLDARIEAIAFRVARQVLAESSRRP
jgi:hypothetical protein